MHLGSWRATDKMCHSTGLSVSGPWNTVCWLPPTHLHLDLEPQNEVTVAYYNKCIYNLRNNEHQLVDFWSVHLKHTGRFK